MPRVPALDVSDLLVRYPGGVTAVDGLSFSAEAGEVVALLGPNGAGKTTTVETLEGYRSPTSGRPTRARASDSRCCSPPDSRRHVVRATPVSPRRSRSRAESSGDS